MKTRFDLSDILLLAGYGITVYSLWQISEWLPGVLTGAIFMVLGLLRSR